MSSPWPRSERPWESSGASFAIRPCTTSGASVIEAVLQRTGIHIDEVIMGCCRQAGNGANPARTAAHRAGLPATVPASTINAACASGIRTVIMASHMLQQGQARFVIAGGMESMSTIPYLLKDSRWVPGDKLLVDGLDDCHDPCLEGTSAACNIVRKYRFTRRDQDRYALESHRRAARAADDGRFQVEIVPVGTVVQDEGIRRDTSMQKLSRLPVFDRGASTTAGNTAAFGDGAAALLLTTRESARAHGLTPLFRIVSNNVSAVDHEWLHEGPSVSLPRALQAARLRLTDLDCIEMNESFAGMVLANHRLLGWDPERFNQHGGTIALGHPSGCTGARLLVSACNILRLYDQTLAGAAISGAGGVTAALVLERES